VAPTKVKGVSYTVNLTVEAPQILEPTDSTKPLSTT
jgi:hypothetical protein